jgi:site-specific recombinase XerD
MIYIGQENRIDKITLDKMLREFISIIRTRDVFLYPIFLLLYNHGFRVKEVLELDRWSDIVEGYYTVQTEKGSAERKIALNDIPSSFSRVLIYRKHGEEYCSYDTVKRRFNAYFKATFCTSDKRKLATHLFRHNFVKQKYAQGMPVEHIAAIIGEKEAKNVMLYVNSEILKYNYSK